MLRGVSSWWGGPTSYEASPSSIDWPCMAYSATPKGPHMHRNGGGQAGRCGPAWLWATASCCVGSCTRMICPSETTQQTAPRGMVPHVLCIARTAAVVRSTETGRTGCERGRAGHPHREPRHREAAEEEGTGALERPEADEPDADASNAGDALLLKGPAECSDLAGTPN